MHTIDPTELYSASAAAKLIPSVRAGKRLNASTLYRWAIDGKIPAVWRQVGHQRQLFLYGETILKLRGEGEQPEAQQTVRSPAQFARDQKAAREALRRFGIG